MDSIKKGYGMILSMSTTLKQKGLRHTWHQYRWYLVFLIFAYYLVRDTFLYILLPLMLYKAF